MSESTKSQESHRNDTLLSQMRMHLHDLCQPLTALQCRLELGNAISDPESLQEAIDGGLEETQRIFRIIAEMRDWLAREETQR